LSAEKKVRQSLREIKGQLRKMTKQIKALKRENSELVKLNQINEEFIREILDSETLEDVLDRVEDFNGDKKL